jgi:hypothetical protein
MHNNVGDVCVNMDILTKVAESRKAKAMALGDGLFHVEK